MASTHQPPPSLPANADTAAPSFPQPSSGRYCRRRLDLGFQINLFLPADGIPPMKVLLHSAWITAVGIVLLRLATAISTASEAKVFAIAGVAFISLPWLLLFLTTAAITALLEAGLYDLTWVFSGTPGGGKPPTKKARRRAFRSGDEPSDYVGDEEAGGSQTETTSSATARLTSGSSVAPSRALTTFLPRDEPSHYIWDEASHYVADEEVGGNQTETISSATARGKSGSSFAPSPALTVFLPRNEPSHHTWDEASHYAGDEETSGSQTETITSSTARETSGSSVTPSPDSTAFLPRDEPSHCVGDEEVVGNQDETTSSAAALEPSSSLTVFRPGDEPSHYVTDEEGCGSDQSETISSSAALETSDSSVAPPSASSLEEVEASAAPPLPPPEALPPTGTETTTPVAASPV